MSMEDTSPLIKQFNLYTEWNEETEQFEVLAILETTDKFFAVRKKVLKPPEKSKDVN